MQSPLRTALAGALLVAQAALAVPTADGERLFHVATRRKLTLAEALKDLRKARVVFLGEAHDNRAHHEAQLKVIRALHEAGVPLAVGLEMFRSSAQEQLDRWAGGGLSEEEFYDVYAQHWNFGWWPVYAPIFRYARDKRIPLIGLNVPQELVTQVARRGFESLSAPQREELGVLRCDVDPRYQELMAALTGTPDRQAPHFQRFCQAQLVWDTAMAKRLAEYAERNPRRALVVLAGTFHAWKHGVPEQLERRAPLPYRVILPAEDEAVVRYEILSDDADYLWLHPPRVPATPAPARPR